MEKYTISPEELKDINYLLNHVVDEFPSADSEEFLQETYILAGELPRSIKLHLNNLKNIQSHSGALIIRGFTPMRQLDDATPKTWFKEDSYTPNTEMDYLAVILSSFLGDAFGFENQQDGKLIHDIVPIHGKEFMQAGCSSLAELSFHTEDAFHACRGDFLCFSCVKNPSSVGTMAAAVCELDIPEDIKNILFQERYFTLPDNSYSIDSLENYNLHSILFGHIEKPYIRLDPDFTSAVEGDQEAGKALQYIIKAIKSKLIEINIEPGSFCFLDNYKWVHGRKSFVANFDGNDRWLKRLNITMDMKNFSSYRQNAFSRIIGSETLKFKS